MIWSDLLALIGNHRSFLISSHLSPDGDSIGSQLSFSWYLQSLGKSVTVYNKDPLPAKFGFLGLVRIISNEPPAGDFDVFVVLDASNPSRLGWDCGRFSEKPAINIDHHRDNSLFGTWNGVDSKAAATGEIIYRFFTECKINFPSDIADALYTAILTDTGGFRFSNTNAAIFRIAADLADRGVKPSKVFDSVYASLSPEALLLHSRIWSSLAYYYDKKVCALELPRRLFKETGAQEADSEGMVDNTITATGVEIGMLIKYDGAKTHFSLRSRGAIDVGRIAQKVPGGGGHSGAAGCTIDRPYSEALAEMLSYIKQVLD